MKLTVNVTERISWDTRFPYPRESDMVTMRIGKDIAKKMSFTQDEIDEINLRVEKDPKKPSQSAFKWDKPKEYEIEFTDLEVKFIQAILKQGRIIPEELFRALDKIESYVPKKKKPEKKEKK